MGVSRLFERRCLGYTMLQKQDRPFAKLRVNEECRSHQIDIPPDWLLPESGVGDSLLGMSEFTPTERTKVKRKPERGTYDRELIYSILDEAFVCSVGFIADGQPFVVPTNYVRVGDRLFLHGSTASRLMRTLASGAPFCLSVTLLDGIVFAPTATGHSVNYRSVVVMGKAEVIEKPEAKLAAMRDFVEYVIRGRWQSVRPPSERELKGTMVLSVPLVEVSAKTRTGFAVDDEENYATPAWTGVVPMKWTAQAPIPDPRGNSKIPPPANALHYSRPQ
jgi:nitroimidazol reductase NimA-like FMN-containing flavoprotein (pyridoxamine 5'-phosphate oxidase superfamily)